MIWFDLDNSPHVPLFKPIFEELDKRKAAYIVTARDYAQTAELLEYWEISHTIIGAHAGKNKIKKILNLLGRAKELSKFIKNIREILDIICEYSNNFLSSVCIFVNFQEAFCWLKD